MYEFLFWFSWVSLYLELICGVIIYIIGRSPKFGESFLLPVLGKPLGEVEGSLLSFGFCNINVERDLS